MAKTPPRFYILHGEDEYNLSLAVQKMRADMQQIDSAGLNLSEIEGSTTTAADVISAVSAYPFLADRRLVIVREMLTWVTRKGAGETGKKQVERLLADLPHLPDWARLVFVEYKALPDANKILKLAQSDAHGYEKTFSVPKDITRWLMSHCQQTYNTALEPMAAQALASVIGSDLRRADNELIKLVSYSDGQPITEEMVALLTPYTSNTIIWDMIEAMASGRGSQAMSMLHKLLDQPDEDPFRVWALFVRQFRQMLLAKEFLEGGGKVGELGSQLGVYGNQANKLRAQVQPFSLAELDLIYKRLKDYDKRVKTGQMNIVMALDVLVATLAR